MANRNDSDMRQHETLPGPGPGPGRNPALTGAPGARPVEQMVDAAIERLAHERELGERESGEQRAHEDAGSSHGRALVVADDSRGREGRVPTRLRWKGLDVSDEFRNYAERVARGEDLPPFEGPVLAEPNPAFPFGPKPLEREAPQERTAGSGRASRIALWTSAAAVLGLIGWSLAQRVDADETSADPSAVPSASPATDIAPLAPSPHDVVETPAPVVKPLEAQAAVVTEEPGVTEGAPSTSAPLDPNQALDAPLQSAVAGASPSEVAASSPQSVVAVAPTPAPAAAATPAFAAPVASLEHAASAAPQPAGPGAPPAATPAASAKVVEDDFGILPSGDGAPVSAPANTALPAAKSVPSVNGNVGDLARSGQVTTGPARKEPGSESSAKGSLLVETPSF
jgi:hypothetical protein